jgi:RalA-binding protein 1
MVMAGQKRKASGRSVEDERRGSPKSASAPSPSPFGRAHEGDVVERGILNMDKAAELFSRYTDRMAIYAPAVIFPRSMTVAELRRTRPLLFLAIMAAAASDTASLQKTLQREVMMAYAEKVFLTGEKSLEMIQALLVSVYWYIPPERMEELKFYQFIHIAAVMAIDIGLGKKPSTRRGGHGLGGGPGMPGVSFPSWTGHPFRRHAPLDPTSLECRRTWLACYYLTSNTAMALHRPNLIRWNNFMSESLDVLSSSPDAAPSDKYFCHLVWTHRHSEEVGNQFATDDSSVDIDLNNPRIQYSLKVLERDLEKYRANVPEDQMKRESPSSRAPRPYEQTHCHYPKNSSSLNHLSQPCLKSASAWSASTCTRVPCRP